MESRERELESPPQEPPKEGYSTSYKIFSLSYHNFHRLKAQRITAKEMVKASTMYSDFNTTIRPDIH